MRQTEVDAQPVVDVHVDQAALTQTERDAQTLNGTRDGGYRASLHLARSRVSQIYHFP